MAPNPADVWLSENKLEPWRYPDRDLPDDLDHPVKYWWYWFSPPVESPEDASSTLPEVLWARLRAKTTYPTVKMYPTREEAMKDFKQAFWAAIRAGELSIPEPRGSPDETSFD